MHKNFSRFLIAGVVLVMLAGGIYFGSAQFSGPPQDRIDLDRYPSNAALQADLVLRYRGGPVETLRADLVKAGAHSRGPVTAESMKQFVKQPLIYDRPVTIELFSKDRRNFSPNPHMLLVVQDATTQTVLDVVVYY